MTPEGSWKTAARRWQARALGIGLAALGLSAVGGWFAASNFFQAYLLAFMWWLGIGLGCLPLLMLHHLVGGRWGAVIRRTLEAGTRTLPLFVLLFLPVVAGMHHLYEWTHADVVAADPILQHKSAYLNTAFFLFRAAVYFAIWLGWSMFLNRWSREQDRLGDGVTPPRVRQWSGLGILAYALAITFASFDWVMSLEPHWFSTIYGMIFMVGQALSALALSVLTLYGLSGWKPMSDVLKPNHLHDLGTLTFAFIMLWAYVSFSQYLIIWSANLPEEITFFLRRLDAGWGWIGLLLVIFHFAVPFALLLSRKTKRTFRAMAVVAALILVLRAVDLYWYIAPAFRESLAPHWLDFTLPIGIGGVWLSMFLRQLAQAPLLPVNDPRIPHEAVIQESNA